MKTITIVPSTAGNCTTLPKIEIIDPRITATAKFGGANTTAINAAKERVDIVNAGNGYIGTPRITLSGGTCSTPPILAATILNGKITAINITNKANVVCTKAPLIAISAPAINPVFTVTKGGDTFNVNFTEKGA